MWAAKRAASHIRPEPQGAIPEQDHSRSDRPRGPPEWVIVGRIDAVPAQRACSRATSPPSRLASSTCTLTLGATRTGVTVGVDIRSVVTNGRRPVWLFLRAGRD